jgi:hypothetical protein
MADAWGGAWGPAWGSAWALSAEVPDVVVPGAGGVITGGSFSRGKWRELQSNRDRKRRKRAPPQKRRDDDEGRLRRAREIERIAEDLAALDEAKRNAPSRTQAPLASPAYGPGQILAHFHTLAQHHRALQVAARNAQQARELVKITAEQREQQEWEDSVRSQLELLSDAQLREFMARLKRSERVSWDFDLEEKLSDWINTASSSKRRALIDFIVDLG